MRSRGERRGSKEKEQVLVLVEEKEGKRCNSYGEISVRRRGGGGKERWREKFRCKERKKIIRCV